MKIKIIEYQGYLIGVSEYFNSFRANGKYVYNNGRLWKWDMMMAQRSDNLPSIVVFADKGLDLGVPVLPNWVQWSVEQLSEKH